jgi:hypothetical protein
MKKLSKVLFLCILLVTSSILCFSKNKPEDEGYFTQAIASLKKGVEWIPEFFDAFKKVDQTVNKDKVKSMATEITSKVNKLILAKQAFIVEVQDNKSDFTKQVDDMATSVEALAETTRKYDDLITAVGLKATNLQYSFYANLFQKKRTINAASTLLNGHPNEQQVRKGLVDYFEKDIKILQESKLQLAKLESL